MKANEANYTAYVAPTTHWDREWIQTQGQYQVRLVRLVDNLIDVLEVDPSFTMFMLDGQTIVLEDYLDIRPERRGQLEKLIRAGRIVVGPWYVLADQFLEDGEATIRNMMIGFRMAREFGAEPMRVGYSPDCFGCIETLPMFMQGFGISSALFRHGMPTDLEEHGLEFTWEAPDGSRILGVYHGYADGLFMSYPDIWTNTDRALPQPAQVLTEMRDAVEEFAGKECSNNLYFSVGVDHMEPRASLPKIVDHLNSHMESVTFRLASPEEFVRAVEQEQPDLVTYRGELRGPSTIELNGVASTHMELKQANFRCQRWLERYVEPLSLMAGLAGDFRYPAELIEKLWKLLVSNHAHDSICACSLDRVCEDIANRFDRIEDVAEQLTDYAARELTQSIDTSRADSDVVPLVVCNTVGYERTDVVRGLVRIPRRFAHDTYHLLDAEGVTVPARVKLSAAKDQDLESMPMTNRQLASVITKDADPSRPDEDVFTVLELEAVVPDVPPMGYKTFWIKRGSEAAGERTGVWMLENGMANEYLELTFNPNGSFDLKDKRTAQRYSPLNYFEDAEEMGDSYGHRCYENSSPLTTLDVAAEIAPTEVLPFRVTYQIRIPWRLPASSSPTGRSSRTRSYPVTTLVTLFAGLDRIEVATRIDNVCTDHRLRVVFDTGIAADLSASEGNFSVTERPVYSANEGSHTHPHQSFADVSDGRTGMSLMNRGLPEFEAVRTQSGASLYLTLIRCVGERGLGGANHYLPGAQCLGDHRFEYAVRPHVGDWDSGGCVEAGRSYTVPLWADGDAPGSGNLPSEGSFATAPGVDVTAFKKARDDDDIVVRLWNTKNEPIETSVSSVVPLESARLTNLNEDALEEVAVRAGSADVKVPAHGLATVRLKGASNDRR